MCADISTDTKTNSYRQKIGKKILQNFNFMCPVSGVTCHVSYVMCLASGVRCQVSGVRCQVSLKRCHWKGIVAKTSRGRPILAILSLSRRLKLKPFGNNWWFCTMGLIDQETLRLLDWIGLGAKSVKSLSGIYQHRCSTVFKQFGLSYIDYIHWTVLW